MLKSEKVNNMLAQKGLDGFGEDVWRLSRLERGEEVDVLVLGDPAEEVPGLLFGSVQVHAAEPDLYLVIGQVCLV